MVGYCQICELRKCCKYLYTEYCPYLIEDNEYGYL